MAKDNLNDTGVVSLSQRTVEEFLQFSEAWFQPNCSLGFIAPWTVLVFQNPQVSNHVNIH